MNKIKAVNKTAVILLAFLLGMSLCCEAEDSSSKAKVVKKTQSNINFNLPEDWPIQEKNGATGPVPIEEYLGIKFSDIGSRLAKLEETVSGFNNRIKTLEDQLKRPRKLREGELVDHEAESPESQNT